MGVFWGRRSMWGIIRGRQWRGGFLKLFETQRHRGTEGREGEGRGEKGRGEKGRGEKGREEKGREEKSGARGGTRCYWYFLSGSRIGQRVGSSLP
jgi:hypothetical protein